MGERGTPGGVGGIDAFLGKGTTITGKLVFEGPGRIEGKVEGEIAAHDTLTIGEGATVNAKVTGTSIIVEGQVTGDVIAKQRLELRPSGRVRGNITAPSLVIHEGAIYHRYTGQTRTIGFTDLQTMLADREAQYLKKMMETLQVIQKVGLENAGIVNMSAQKSRIYMSKETAKGLTLIDQGQLVQEQGSPAYVVMGNIDLEQVVHAPLDDADKNLPSETAKLLLPLVQKTYRGLTGISPSQVTQLLKHLGIDGDNHHCVLEPKFRRKFVTRAGIEAITDFIRKDPTAALKAFGSRLANAKFAFQNPVAPPIQMPRVIPPEPPSPTEMLEAAPPNVVKH